MNLSLFIPAMAAVAGLSLAMNRTFAQNPGKAPVALSLEVELPAENPVVPVGDQRPARVFIDFEKILRDRGIQGAVDLSTLKVVGLNSEGQPIQGAKFAYAQDPEEVPLRWDDAAIPYEFPVVDGAVDANTGKLSTSVHERFGSTFNINGDGRSGFLVWTHTKTAQSGPARYRVSFNAIPDAKEAVGVSPRAWIGDGVPRFSRDAPTTTGSLHTRVSVADWNGDGLEDIIAGEYNGLVIVLLNRGTNTEPRFPEQRLVLDGDGRPIDAGLTSAPLVVDWDGDGAEDLLIGTHWNRILFYRNVGTNSERKLRYQGLVMVGDQPLELPWQPVKGRPEGVFLRDYFPVLEAVDWDNDGDLDLLAGGYVTGFIYFFENTNEGRKGLPKLKNRGPVLCDGQPLNVGDWGAAPTVADFNGDGLPDIISGRFPVTRESRAQPNELRYFVNVGKPGRPEFRAEPFPREGTFPRTSLESPRAVDFNGDGLIDLVMSAVSGNIHLFPNIGTKTQPKFQVDTPIVRPDWGNTPLDVAQFLDWNGDGLVDVFSDDYTIRLNDGTGDPFFFTKKIPLLRRGERIAHPSGIGDDWFYPRIFDFFGRGHMDILFGDWFGHVWLHERKPDGSYDLEGRKLVLESGEPIKVGPKDGNPGANFRDLQGARTAFTVADFDGDGLNDLVVGDTFGVVRLFLNRGRPDAPVFQEGRIIGDLKQRLSVDVVDWNEDGHPDIIAGSANGRLEILLNSGAKSDDVSFDVERPDVPKINQPRAIAVDLNGDKDVDIFFPSTQGAVFVERSFLRHGYAEGKLIKP